jgi:hypothetical protein
VSKIKAFLLCMSLCAAAPAASAHDRDALRDMRAQWATLLAFQRLPMTWLRVRFGELTPMNPAWTAASWTVLASLGKVNVVRQAQTTFKKDEIPSATRGFRSFWFVALTDKGIARCRAAVVADGDLATSAYDNVSVYLGACTQHVIEPLKGGLGDFRVDFTREQLKHEVLRCEAAYRQSNELCERGAPPSWTL